MRYERDLSVSQSDILLSQGSFPFAHLFQGNNEEEDYLF
jgi:hypothetical protein